MASKKILVLLGSDRLAYPLLKYLAAQGKAYGWQIRIGCMFDSQLAERIKSEKVSEEFSFVNFTKIQECEQAIKKSDIVIGFMADNLLLQVADSCIKFRKALISPGRLNRQMAIRKPLAQENEVLILMDCGVSPGLDHITAKKAIDNIHLRGGEISSFKTYSGSFVDKSTTLNPWGFKFAEPAGDVLSWGRHNNRHIIDGQLQHIPYHQLFERSRRIDIRDQRDLVSIPEGDSLYYRKIYGLTDAHTVLKSKLANNGMDRLFNLLIQLGLTDMHSRIDLGTEGSFYKLLESLLPVSSGKSLEEKLRDYTGASFEEVEKLRWLGLFDDSWIEGVREITAATALQVLMEDKFPPLGEDPDRVVMEHHLAYEFRDELFEFSATLIMEGEDQKDSAAARITGYICGAAAKAVLLGSIKLRGLHIPVLKEIYDPILNELEELGVAFHVNDTKIQAAAADQPV